MSEIYTADRKTEVGLDAKIVLLKTIWSKKEERGRLTLIGQYCPRLSPEAAGSNHFLKSHLRTVSRLKCAETMKVQLEPFQDVPLHSGTLPSL